MIRPDDEDKPFVARWNTLVRVLLVESSVKLVARTAMDYADLYDGSGVFTGNVRMALGTGYTDKTIRVAWATLRGLDLAERVSYASGASRKADEYDLMIPDNWAALAALGPREKRFRCIYCDGAFNPPVNAVVLRKNGTVGWRIAELVFCPPPRARRGSPAPPSCFAMWKRENGGEGAWKELGHEGVWKLFRKARDDDW